ncbi:unnamed protein product [Gongylonema pulchrum]|uniref:Uncharacterized protein n=1 Tax=Gongylonema pulchrum TaxID=637853 RepID=A0A183DYY0_9BILA|nr:unnamed protein product [Gongylonema pulchrum]
MEMDGICNEVANAVNAALNRLGKKQIDDDDNLSEPNSTLDKKKEKKYIWAHAGISNNSNQMNKFYMQSSKIPVCFIKATREEGIVRLEAECIVDNENLMDIKKIPMHNITEEAANVLTETSAKITDLMEQFKKETAFYEKETRRYIRDDYDQCKIFRSTQISKIARTYSEMHPESNYSHVHTYEDVDNLNFGVYYFFVHP